MTNEEIIQQAAEMLRQRGAVGDPGQVFAWTWSNGRLTRQIAAVDYRKRPDGVGEMAQE